MLTEVNALCFNNSEPVLCVVKLFKHVQEREREVAWYASLLPSFCWYSITDHKWDGKSSWCWCRETTRFKPATSWSQIRHSTIWPPVHLWPHKANTEKNLPSMPCSHGWRQSTPENFPLPLRDHCAKFHSSISNMQLHVEDMWKAHIQREISKLQN